MEQTENLGGGHVPPVPPWFLRLCTVQDTFRSIPSLIICAGVTWPHPQAHFLFPRAGGKSMVPFGGSNR